VGNRFGSKYHLRVVPALAMVRITIGRGKKESTQEVIMYRRLILALFSMIIGLAGVVVLLSVLPGTGSAKAASILCVQPGNVNCFHTISDAITAAGVGDTIQVAAGTYVENVIITKTLTLEGGWDATFTHRDPALYITNINPSNAALAVVTVHGQFGNTSAVAPTIDGFAISGARSTNHGGGIRSTNSDIIVSHNVITDNVAYFLGGGMWVQNGKPRIENNTIDNNLITPSGGAYGGGIELEGTQATLTGNVIEGNIISSSIGYGGGVAIDGGGPVTLTGNTITANSAASKPGTIADSGYGGGVSVQNAPVTMNGNLIQGNFANSYGDLTHYNAVGNGGGIYLSNSNGFVLTGNTIDSNVTAFSYVVTNDYKYGGGLVIDSSLGTLTDNIITNNMANRYTIFGNGGGLAVMGSTLQVQGGRITGNKTSLNCEGYGGGLYAFNSSITIDATQVENNCAANTPAYGLGSGLAFFNSPYTVTNSIIDQNISYANDSSVGGVYASLSSPGMVVNSTIANNKGQGIRVASPLTAVNTIIMSQTTGISTTHSAPVSVIFNDFYNNITNQRGFSLDPSNIVINPNLDASYHLNAGSPVIDAGTANDAPFHDIDGETRPMTGPSGLFRFDIGADEFTGMPQVTRDLSTQPADYTLIGPGNPQDYPASDGSNDWIGFAVLGGDINGDHRADLVVGAPNLSGNFDGGTNDDGRVFSIYNNGTTRMGVTDLYSTTADLEVRSWITQQHLGRSFAASDLNGDGFNDLIIGSIGGDNNGQLVTGTVYVFAGGPGLMGTLTLSPTMEATYRFLPSESTQSFAEANSLAAGQLDGNGPADLAVGERNGTGPGGRAQAGVVRVFFGSNSLPAAWDTRVLPASLTIYGPAINSQLGQLTLADFNGDSKLDLIVRSVDTIYVFYGPLSAGTIDLASVTADITIGGLGTGPLAAGDVNGDHLADILVGDGNRVQVISGGTAATLATFTNVTPSALLGADWNTDGKADVVIGESTKNRVMVLLGGSPWLANADAAEQANLIINGERPTDQFGYSLSGADLNADGGQDLILGSRTHTLNNRSDPHFNDAGAVYVLYGQPGAPTLLSVFLPTVNR
jgi:parallel beta-helix repeat protein